MCDSPKNNAALCYVMFSSIFMPAHNVRRRKDKNSDSFVEDRSAREANSGPSSQLPSAQPTLEFPADLSPFGGSFVIFTPDWSTGVGKVFAGMLVSQSR